MYRLTICTLLATHHGQISLQDDNDTWQVHFTFSHKSRAAHLLSLCQKALASISNSFMKAVQVGSNSHEVAVCILQNDLQGRFLWRLPFAPRCWFHACFRLHNCLQTLHQLLVLLQCLLWDKAEFMNISAGTPFRCCCNVLYLIASCSV